MSPIGRSLLRRIAFLSMAALAAFAVPGPAAAIFCSNCGTEWTQIANNLKLVAQLEEQVASKLKLIQQYENMLTNTQGLSSLTWSNALSEIKSLSSLFSSIKSLSFSTSDLVSKFSSKYSDFDSYVSGNISGSTLKSKFQQWSEDTNSSVLTTLRAAKLQKEQIEGDEDTYLRSLQSLTETAEGRMQALQVANQIGIQQARQTQKLRTLMAATMQLQANYMQTQMDREVAQTAAWRSFAKKTTISTTDGTRY